MSATPMSVPVDVFDRLLEDLKRKYQDRAASQPRMTELEVKRAERDFRNVVRAPGFDREAFVRAFENSRAAYAQRYVDDPEQLERVFRRMFRPVAS
jgi:hypothetical protein